MLPILQFASDGREHSHRETIVYISDYFMLTPEERDVRIPSGRQALIDNRVAWAQTYLRGAGLISATRRAHYRITDNGMRIQSNPPEQFDAIYLRNIPAFIDFLGRSRENRSQVLGAENQLEPINEILGTSYKTPEEILSETSQSMRSQLANEILDKVRQGSPAFFERLVVDLLQAMGYGGASSASGQVTGRSGDGGIDGIITEDRLGLDAVYLQAKRWQANVGRPTVQEFAGAMQGHKADKGVIITTSEFTAEARDYVRTISTRIVLIGGAQLVNLMIDHGVGVRTVDTYVVRRVDGDYFEDA